jgi:hypothetical protein
LHAQPSPATLERTAEEPINQRAGGRDPRSYQGGTFMAWKDKFRSGVKRVSEEAEEALDKGKAKVEELQIELKMDGLAKKLGYVAFDAHRGRKVDEALRAKLLADLTYQEEQLKKLADEVAAKAKAAKKK